MSAPFVFPSVTTELGLAAQTWWQTFEAQQDTLHQSLSADSVDAQKLAGWMDTHLGAVDPELNWEFGPGAQKAHRLIITPQSSVHLRPLARYLIETAPQLDRWEFTDYRPPEGLDVASSQMEHRAGWPDLSGITFEMTEGDFHCIDICFHLPFNDPEGRADGKAFLLTELLLGEKALDKWIGVIATAKAEKGFLRQVWPAKQPETKPLEELQQEFLTLKAAIQARQQVPLSALPDDTEWCMFKLQPEEQDDYADKQDLLVAPFASQDLFNALHGGRNFFSAERFTPHQETLLYLKLDGAADDVDQHKFADRAEIEDALTAALGREKIGDVIGGSTGLRYSYVDLAVTDLSRALELMRSTLQDGKLTKRSWIQFHDAELQAEWLGIYEDSPKPLMSA